MAEFHYEQVKNPQYFAQGRLEAHSDHICYANEQEAAAKSTSLR